MKSILSTASRDVLRTFAMQATLIAMDFDGTLAPIVEDRRLASLRPATRILLAALAARYPCVVISGRARTDVEGRLHGTGIKTVIGNHGIEPWHATPAMEKTVLGWIPGLHHSLQSFRGIAIENKRFSVAVHYRNAVDHEGARRAIQNAARELGAVRVVGGKMVINLLPLAAPHKGLALQREVARCRCIGAIYAGDDDTDEDVFALRSKMRQLLTVRIGAKRDSLAEYYLRDQQEMDGFIKLLVKLRDGASAAPQAARFRRRKRTVR